MQKHLNWLFAALIAGIGSVSQAEVALKDATEIAGTWTLEAVAPSLSKPKIPEQRTWEIRTDGVIRTYGYNRHIHQNDEYQQKYTLQDGKIQVEWPGRPGKFITYSVYEISGDSMILQGGIEGFYFFKKK